MNRIYRLFLLLVLSISHLTCFASNEISRADFFQPPSLLIAKVSPDGKYIATIDIVDGKQQLNLRATKNSEVKQLIDVAKFNKKGEASLNKLIWIDSQHIAVELIEIKKGVENLLDTKVKRNMLIVSIPRASKPSEIYSVRTRGGMVSALNSEENVFLYAKNGINSRVYKIDVRKLALHDKALGKLDRRDGGQFKKSSQVKSISGYAIRWFTGEDNKVKAVLHFNKEGKLQLSSFDDKDKSKKIKVWSETSKGKRKEKKVKEKLFFPIAITSEKDTFYCLDFNEGEIRSLYKINFITDKKELIYESKAFQITDVIQTNDDKIVGVQVINNGKLQTEFFDDEKIEITKEPVHSKAKLEVVINSSLNNIAVVYAESFSNPGVFSLYNMKTGNAKNIGIRFPRLGSKLASQQIEGYVDVNNLSIPYILNLPKNVKNKIPLVVVPHGGPIGVFDTLYYDEISQSLVNEGYAILRVNFRGSSGYSKELKEAGKKQWGNLMLEDIYQATIEVTKRQEIDADKVCVFGMSYGGYAATMLAIKHPELIKCAANWAGVSDINLHLNSTKLSDSQIKWSKEYIGDVRDEFKKLKEISPVYLVKKLKVPLLLAHGEKDDVVDIEQAFRLKLMLDKYHKNYQWYFDPEGDHGFGSSKQKVLFFNKLNKFLASYLK